MKEAIAALSLATALSAPAANIVWTNTAGGNWNTAANWNPNTVPGAPDTAVITNDGNYTVALNASATLAGLHLGGASGTQTLAQAAHTMTLNGPGTLGPHGRYNWSGGTLAGTNALVVMSGGQVNLSGTGVKTLNGALTNAGTVVWSGAGGIFFYGVLHNAAGGLVDAQTNAIMAYISGTPVFVNEGTFRKSAGTGNTDIEPPFVNNGTVDAQTGTLRFANRDKTFNHGCRFVGAGTNLLAGGTVTLAGEVTSENLQLGGSTLAGAGTLHGLARWTSGSLGAGGALTVAADGTLQLPGSVVVALSGALTNAGTVVWSGTGDIYHYGIIHNQVSGVFEVQSNEQLSYISGTPLFINDGTFRKTASTGTTDIETAFVNHGMVDAQAGTIRFSNRDKTFNHGCSFTGAGTNLLAGGTVTLAGEVTSENLQLGGSTLAGTGTLHGLARWTGGSLGAGGALTIATDGTLQLPGSVVLALSGALTNAGTVVWSGTGDIYLYGILHNQTGGLFEAQNNEPIVHISGTPAFINDGTFRKTAATGYTDIEPSFVNNGTVDAQTGTIRFLNASQPKTFNDGCRFIGAGTNLLTAGTVTLAGTVSSQNLTLNGATLAGTGTVDGSFYWYGGTLSSTVSFNVSPGSLLLLASSGIKTLNGSITNAGTVRWTGTGDIYLYGVIHNQAGGLFDAQNNAPIRHISGTPVFINDGTLRKSVGTGYTDLEPSFVNNGTVEAQTGTIRFLNASQPKTLNSGCRFNGAGTNLLLAGTVTLAGTIYSDNLTLNGATLAGAGGVDGSFYWFSGTVSAGLSFNVTTNGRLILASSGIKTISGTITNAGLVAWSGTGDLYVYGAIHNLPGGLFDLQNDEYLRLISGTPVFHNQGTLRKSAGTNFSTCEIPLSNSGRVEVYSGTLRFTGSTYTHTGGTIQLAGGTFYSAKPLNLNAGLLSGWGTVDASVTNGATVSMAGAGTLKVTGHYDQTLDGNVEFELGGSSPGITQSRLNVTGNAHVNGSVTVRRASGYLPAPGDTFVVLGAPAVSGTFKCFNGFFFLGDNRRLTVTYNPADVTLSEVNAPDPAALLFIGRDTQVIVCWPWEFPGFSLYANTNLTTTNWTLISGVVTNRYLELPGVPEKYFRLSHP
jgi:hypothetical protein